jgi:protein TonB
MVTVQPLDQVYSFVRPALARRNRAVTTALGASIAVHVLIGAYLINSTFHPFNLPQPPESPTVDARTVVLEPPRPLSPTKPFSPPRLQLHAPASPVPDRIDTLPVNPTKLPTQDAITNTPATLGDGPMASPPELPLGPARITNPEWLSRPDAARVARAYPDLAAREGLGGMVMLACEVTAAGGVTACDVVSESPSGRGFAKAALSLTRYFRMKPRTENGQPVSGASVLIPIRFAVAGG